MFSSCSFWSSSDGLRSGWELVHVNTRRVPSSVISGVGLDSDPGSGLASACAIILEDNLRRILLNDEWFFGIVGFGGSWLGGRLSANAAQIKARTQTQHEEAQILRHQVGCT